MSSPLPPHSTAARPPGGRRKLLARSLALGVGAIVMLGLAACAGTTPDLRLDPHPLVLLGEVHDNAEGHRLRLQAFDALLARGARPALLMEQFDRTDQAVIDAALARRPAPSALALVADVLSSRPGRATTMGDSGWNWSFYVPFVERALHHGLPIVAANVGRDEARQVMREGLAALGFDAAVPDDVLAGIAHDIRASHCGQVDEVLARRMALAQVARDQQMARSLEAQAARGAVLLAGNGHVRTDLGAPRWLSATNRRRSVAVGVLETGDDPSSFDRHVFVPAQSRPDPCERMQRPG